LSAPGWAAVSREGFGGGFISTGKRVVDFAAAINDNDIVPA
jgi:hypothetical protein